MIKTAEKTITLVDLINYADSMYYEAWCIGSTSELGDDDPEAVAYSNKCEAAEKIIADFFYDGDEEKAEQLVSLMSVALDHLDLRDAIPFQ